MHKSLEKWRKASELQDRFSVFHKDVHRAIAQVTGKNEIQDAPEEQSPRRSPNNDALYDRLAAGPEVKKLEVYNI
jgi:hypothetical protein